MANTSQLSYEISTIFNDHEKALKKLRNDTYQQVDDWNDELIQRIRNHTSKQKQCVNDFCDKWQKYFRDLREQYLANSQYVRKDDKEDINRLLENCRKLNVKFVEFTFSSRDTAFIEVKPTEVPEQTAQEKHNPTDTNSNRFGNQSIGGSNINHVHNRDTSSAPFIRSASASISTENQTRTTIQLANDHNSVKFNNNNNNAKTNSNDDNDHTNDKCPICHMIFPPNMVGHDRQRHSNAHYQNE